MDFSKQKSNKSKAKSKSIGSILRVHPPGALLPSQKLALAPPSAFLPTLKFISRAMPSFAHCTCTAFVKLPFLFYSSSYLHTFLSINPRSPVRRLAAAANLMLN